MEKAFLRLNEIQQLGLPAARTLRNGLNAQTGEIRIGGDVPPLQTLLLGGSRVVTRAEIERWLRQVEAISNGTSAQPVSSEEPRRRRGRPRKSIEVQA